MDTKNSSGAFVLGLAAAILATGCSTAPKTTESGFLSDYSLLHQMPAPDGGTRLVYLNPDFNASRYTAVWLDPIEYYPEPQPSADVSMETLTEIRVAVNETLRRKVGEQVRLVDRAGPGVARIRIAITAVGTSEQALRAYQYIPVALVMTEARAAMEGGMARDASVAIESRVTDSMSDELLYASVRGGTGEKVANATQGAGGVRLSKLQPLIDEWTSGAAREIGKYVRQR
ncbi:DUF3313 domain-containing protein [Achromobacter aegrifaciens]|uniref:DUF3313 domain-containing protein n=1 Tax=Achromobacter aegrifaciens TaxID=1287736 RepID=UPI001465695B|nr:DUF3313 domain-containing protein [Achromobacter aegrifaciens]CAB3687057.1 hypothetical protein LMG26852_04461 [Achromobacter aegrifaciens]